MPYNSFARREIDIEGRSMTYIGKLAQYEYEPHGGAFQFTGHRWDAEVGMYYAPFRMYDPDIMRCISTRVFIQGT
jgi:RHS repeat-associated protein